jgi:hypothetical protein
MNTIKLRYNGRQEKISNNNHKVFPSYKSPDEFSSRKICENLAAASTYNMSEKNIRVRCVISV